MGHGLRSICDRGSGGVWCEKYRTGAVVGYGLRSIERGSGGVWCEKYRTGQWWGIV